MRRALAPLFSVVLVFMVATTTVAASQVVQRTWRASLAAGAAHGREMMTGYTDGTGTIDLQLTKMRPGWTYSAQIWAGTCSHLSKRLVSFNGLKTDSSGNVAQTRNIGNSVMNRIWYYARPGSIAIRFISGGSVQCGNWTYYHATRVRIPNYGIDLAVVPGPSGYPYCNVAMYQRVLWQPTEPGISFIYAHARKGMFLPLLSASKVNNGAAMIGKLVYVYTNNSEMYTYKITQVRRHVKSVQSAVGIQSEHLWLQTSEGPNFTYPKLVIVADRIATTPAAYKSSHPAVHIVHCS
jgi:hypothetical protein